MCQQASETLDHIVLGCVFSREVWHRLLSRLHLQDLTVGGDLDLFVWWSRARLRVPRMSRKGFGGDLDLFVWWSRVRLRVPRMSRKGFDSLVALTCWSL
jgi:hypothetical protein